MDLTREEAMEIDRGHGAYSDCGESADGLFRVWGEKSGFCYASFQDISDACETGCDLHAELMKNP